jgi:hypothetical protein
MLEGRGNTGGWLIVGLAAVALLAFTGLLYVRGGGGPPIALSGDLSSPASTTAPSGSGKPGASGSGLTAGISARPGASRAPASATSGSAGPTGVVAAATSDPSGGAPRTPRPSRTPSPTPFRAATEAPGTPGPAVYHLPRSPQAASVALENGQGGCPKLATGGVVIETSFSVTSGDRLSATSPSMQRMTGRLTSTGAFTLAGPNPQERWSGTLTDTGGTGSYVIVSGGCTEGYETTIAFH